MATITTIRHRIDLAVTFVDSVSGTPASGHIELFGDGEKLDFRLSSDGTALLMDSGREDFTLRVVMTGYEPEEVRIAYEDIDKKMPLTEVRLTPVGARKTPDGVEDVPEDSAGMRGG
jgi:hypothetical protein